MSADVTNSSLRSLALTPANLATLQARPEAPPRRPAAAPPADAPAAATAIAPGRGRFVNILV
jgi:hypothetical protein